MLDDFADNRYTLWYAMAARKKDAALVLTSVRLFKDDVRVLKTQALEKRSKWQTELRHLVHRALEGQRKFGGVLR